MSEALDHSNKGKELNRIRNSLAGIEHHLQGILEKGEADETDLARIAKGMETARAAVDRLYDDFMDHPGGWGQEPITPTG
jgi:hypothetical protein